MKSVAAEYNLPAFFCRLKKAEKRALILDYDGTLAPFSIRREEAFLYPGLRKMLNQFLELEHTRIVIVTGRAIPSLLSLLKFERRPEIWGTHGLERLLPDGNYSLAKYSELARNGLKESFRWIESEGLADYCERKLSAVAIHTRGLDAALADKIIEKATRGLSRFSENGGLVLQAFDGGIELRVKGVDKGVAVVTILEELGENGSAAYLGDDHTDEDAFRVIKDRGLGVLVRKEFRPTAANLWLKPPEELFEFLTGWLEVLGGETWQDNQKVDSS
jgi:trehalose 6-phosphate phosphatase